MEQRNVTVRKGGKGTFSHDQLRMNASAELIPDSLTLLLVTPPALEG